MTLELNKVAIVGAGAMGGMYASHFIRQGFDLRFVARGERAQRLRNGLVINGEHMMPRVVDADIPDGWSAELMIFAVKDRHLDEAIADAAAVVDHNTIILSVLNGLDSEEIIAQQLQDRPTVLLSIALGMDAERLQNNEIRFRQVGKIVFGNPRNDELSDPVLAVQKALTRAQLGWETPVDMRHRMWWKFMVNVSINQASAVMDLPYGAFQQEGPARSLMSALVNEVVAVANAEGVSLGEEDVAQWHAVLANQPAEGRTSMHQDVLAGRPTEVNTFAGRVVELGKKHGIPTPYNQTMAWQLASS